jgi:hypothetical protein
MTTILKNAPVSAVVEWRIPTLGIRPMPEEGGDDPQTVRQSAGVGMDTNVMEIRSSRKNVQRSAEDLWNLRLRNPADTDANSDE